MKRFIWSLSVFFCLVIFVPGVFGFEQKMLFDLRGTWAVSGGSEYVTGTTLFVIDTSNTDFGNTFIASMEMPLPGVGSGVAQGAYDASGNTIYVAVGGSNDYNGNLPMTATENVAILNSVSYNPIWNNEPVNSGNTLYKVKEIPPWKHIFVKASSGTTATRIPITIRSIKGRGEVPVWDATTRATVMLTYAHHELHAGNAFSYGLIDSDVDSGETRAVTVYIPPGKKYTHIIPFFAASSGGARLTLIRSPTVILNGSAQSIVNSKEPSTKTSINTVRLDPGIIQGTGVSIYRREVGSGQNTSGEIRATSERILGTTGTSGVSYVYLLESFAANNRLTLELDWYEHTDK